MSDIVERLRDRAYSSKFVDTLLAHAADEIERLRSGAPDGCETVRPETTLDASPEAIATADRYVRRAAADGDSDRTDKAAPRPSEGTGETPLDVEELLGRLQSLAESGEGSTYAIRTTACDAECAIERLRAWVNELQLSKVEIDALRRVVENGRFVDMYDYGLLRSLLVRLRPEWEGADRSQPVKDAESDRSKPINADRLATASDRVVPLYRSPTLTDAEREALEAAARIIDAYEEERDGFPSGAAATLRGLLERLGSN